MAVSPIVRLKINLKATVSHPYDQIGPLYLTNGDDWGAPGFVYSSDLFYGSYQQILSPRNFDYNNQGVSNLPVDDVYIFDTTGRDEFTHISMLATSGYAGTEVTVFISLDGLTYSEAGFLSFAIYASLEQFVELALPPPPDGLVWTNHLNTVEISAP